MKTLIIAEHDNQTLKVATLNAVAAAQAMGGDIDVLVVGSGCQSVADQAAAVPGVGVVLSADNAAYENQLAENVSLAIAEAATSYDCVMAAATANGKNVMPRVAALLDVAQISDITAILDADTGVFGNHWCADAYGKCPRHYAHPPARCAALEDAST